MMYMIHAYPTRMWYVDEFLVPSMTAQGIAREDITIWNDTDGRGNLFAFLDSLESIQDEPGGTWHIQDDVIIGRRFRELTEEHDVNGVVQGFCCRNFELAPARVGWCNQRNAWYSFPCQRIPNEMAKSFLKWFYDKAMYVNAFQPHIVSRKGDDWFWKEYLRIEHPQLNVYNLDPNIVDHIDFLLGGTLVNQRRIAKINRAEWFPDRDLVDELAEKLKNR